MAKKKPMPPAFAKMAPIGPPPAMPKAKMAPNPGPQPFPPFVPKGKKGMSGGKKGCK